MQFLVRCGGGKLKCHNIFFYQASHTKIGVSMSLFEIKCPLCKGTLWIDPASGKVVDHRAFDKPKADLKEFIESQKKGTAWDDRFQKAKEEEAKRKAEIEKKFKQAKENDTDLPEPMQSPFDWD